jgi:hypothetical protein
MRFVQINTWSGKKTFHERTAETPKGQAVAGPSTLHERFDVVDQQVRMPRVMSFRKTTAGLHGVVVGECLSSQLTWQMTNGAVQLPSGCVGMRGRSIATWGGARSRDHHTKFANNTVQ